MPFTMCPICGATMHLNVTDHRAWYADKHPEVPFGAMVPSPCLFCFPELEIGDQVVTRKLINDSAKIDPGQTGQVTAIRNCKGFGKIYVVSLDSEQSIVLPRAALRKTCD